MGGISAMLVITRELGRRSAWLLKRKSWDCAARPENPQHLAGDRPLQLRSPRSTWTRAL